MTILVTEEAAQDPRNPLQMTSTGRRHFGKNITGRTGCCVMESLAETEVDGESGEENESESSALVKILPQNQSISCQTTCSNMRLEDVREQHTSACTPFFGVKHYLNSFYGLPLDFSDSEKIWQRFETVSLKNTYIQFSNN